MFPRQLPLAVRDRTVSRHSDGEYVLDVHAQEWPVVHYGAGHEARTETGYKNL